MRTISQPKTRNRPFVKQPEVRAKKHLGQHFLTDNGIAESIVNLLSGHGGYKTVLEIGPGTGVLTRFLVQHTEYDTVLMDVDKESIAYLHKNFPDLKEKTLLADFLKTDLDALFPGSFAVIGNFPYNISSQIFFKLLPQRKRVPEIVCMLQREVARRLCSPPGNKEYGILSVLLQAFYTTEYCFTVDENNFDPPPKVKSGVIRLQSNNRPELGCDERLFLTVVKQGFNNRRKTLRNALKPLNLPAVMHQNPVLDKRAEQLSVDDFVALTNLWVESCEGLPPLPGPAAANTADTWQGLAEAALNDSAE